MSSAGSVLTGPVHTPAIAVLTGGFPYGQGWLPWVLVLTSSTLPLLRLANTPVLPLAAHSSLRIFHKMPRPDPAPTN